MRHPKAEKFELRLKKIFDEIDAHLEKKYGGRFPLHPARAAPGTTANPESDGLFDIGAVFSPGFGSRTGPGYVVDINMVTLAHIPQSVREEIAREVEHYLRKELPRVFPDRKLNVVREGRRFRISGDLSLGTL